MRRILTFLTAVALLLVSIGVGVFTADLPFWRRVLRLPLAPDAVYLPVATIGADAPGALALAAPAEVAIEAAALEEAATRAREAGTRALLVMHGGRLVLERYFGADDMNTLMAADLMTRPLVAMAIGTALHERRIPSLDAPVATFLPEWDDEPRGRITVRQLLEETSGLETGGDLRAVFTRSPFADLSGLPRFATSNGVRMLLGNDFESTALGFALEHEPGGFYNISPANSQLAAVIVERATGVPYETYIDERIWRRVGGGRAQLPLDRRSGMPAAHCCWRATARDMLRVANLLATDGIFAREQVLPPGWVSEMTRASRVNAETGLQLRRVSGADTPMVSARDDAGSVLWVVAEQQLAVLSIANPGGGAAEELPQLLLRAVRER